MPFMIVSDDEYELELKRLNGDSPIRSNNLVVEQTTELGRGNTPEVPEALREVIAEEKLSGTSARDLSKIFGVSPSSISAYAHGATSTASYHQPKDRLLNVRTRVSSRAANRLNEALKALANKDLERETAKDISSIAKDMATVFDKISPVKQQEREDDKHLHLHLYAPKQKSIEDYETIDVSEKL